MVDVRKKSFCLKWKTDTQKQNMQNSYSHLQWINARFKKIEKQLALLGGYK